ncbi:hypothetical protein [Nocardia tengchongensis]|uniref:hypothetical protein n=1 Tax=Nocardia tengchongensis TaxID=2055889 RepID=UPI0036B87002
MSITSDARDAGPRRAFDAVTSVAIAVTRPLMLFVARMLAPDYLRKASYTGQPAAATTESRRAD